MAQKSYFSIIRRIFGVILCIGGIILIFLAQYIQARVEQGKEQISSAEQKVGTAGALFSLSPYTRDVGKQITNSAQKKINEGKMQVFQYTELAGRIQIGGIALIAVGAFIALFPKKKRS